MAKPPGTCADIPGIKVEDFTFVLGHFVLLELSQLVESFVIPSQPSNIPGHVNSPARLCVTLSGHHWCACHQCPYSSS